MDPFVVTSLGKKTLRTRVIRHNLHPIFDEKGVFQVMKHEQNYTISFTVMDRDQLSGNDLVATAEFPLQTLISNAPEADPETGLYKLQEPPAAVRTPPATKSRFRLPISRSSSTTNLAKLSKSTLKSKSSTASLSSQLQLDQQSQTSPTIVPENNGSGIMIQVDDADSSSNLSIDENYLKVYVIPLSLKNKDRWEDKHSPELYIKAKYMPYRALRQQFWRVMLRQYDADDSSRISKIELTTMLDTLGSTLKESTIDDFFTRFASENQFSDTADLTFDQAVICLEDTLQKLQKKTLDIRCKIHQLTPAVLSAGRQEDEPSSSDEVTDSYRSDANIDEAALPTPSDEEQPTGGDEYLEPDGLFDERGEEHVIEIRECPLCHQPRLGKRSDADIIMHLATCASQDWRQVDNLVMGGFVTSSQAQRKWYTKVINKISYGGYRLGANSANILVQDRITGQISEERMSVYIRLGIRLLYKGLKGREMEKKRSEYFNS